MLNETELKILELVIIANGDSEDTRNRFSVMPDTQVRQEINDFTNLVLPAIEADIKGIEAYIKTLKNKETIQETEEYLQTIKAKRDLLKYAN